MSLLPGPNCKQCPLFMRLHTYVPSTINRKVSREIVDIVICGEAPGKDEVAKKEGFVGSSGRFLDTMLINAGIKREEVRVTNVLKCNPKDNKLPEDLEQAIYCCKPILEEDIKGCKVVIGVGAVPLKAFTGLNKILARRGSVYELPEGQAFIATLHPSFLRRLEFIKEKKIKIAPISVIEADLHRAIRILKGENWKEWKEATFIVYPAQKDMWLFLDRLYSGKEKYVAVDIETTYNPECRVPIICGFAFKDLALCSSFDEDVDFIYKALKSPTPKIFHHGLFDVGVMKPLGFDIVNWNYDTMYMHRSIHSELRHSLGFVQSLYTWMPYHKDMVNHENVDDDDEEEKGSEDEY